MAYQEGYKIEGKLDRDQWESAKKFSSRGQELEARRVKRMDPWQLRQRHADILMEAVREAGRHLNVEAIEFIRNRTAHAQ